MMEIFEADWSIMLKTDPNRRGNDGNKLITYKYSKWNIKWKSIVKYYYHLSTGPLLQN